jgi:DNA-binding CsgD family transcriptional regulator
MADSFHALFHALLHTIATAPSEETLRYRLMDGASECFGVQRWGITLFEDDWTIRSIDTHGVTDDFIDRYQKFGKSVDPVLQYVLQNHAPAHELLVLPPGAWRGSELYQHCCSQYDHEHIMTGPIVGNGQLIGTINFARVRATPAFESLDLARLGALCSHLSTRLAQLRCPSERLLVPIANLTPRELQIANLVAKGLTNAEIGAELWITQNSVKQALKRMFRKLQVSARTEMVARLRDRLE